MAAVHQLRLLFQIIAPPAPHPVAFDPWRCPFADPGAAGLLERPRNEPVEGGHDLPVQNIIDLPLFDETSVGIDVTEPEAEKMIFQKVILQRRGQALEWHPLQDG